METAILILSIIGVIFTWINTLTGADSKFNIVIHAICALALWPISLGWSIVAIVLGGISLLLNYLTS